MPTGYVCGCRGQHHDELPLSYGIDAPAAWSGEYEGREDSVLEDEYCVVGGEHHFIKGNVEIPVLDTGETFAWTVWVSLSGANMQRALDLWTTPGRESEPPYFGWSCTGLPLYEPTTIGLKTPTCTPGRSGAGRRTSWSQPTTRSPSSSAAASPGHACGSSPSGLLHG
jgi:hypothetical protein